MAAPTSELAIETHGLTKRFRAQVAVDGIDLAAAMRGNPYLKVLSMNGWYDMATPFFGA